MATTKAKTNSTESGPTISNQSVAMSVRIIDEIAASGQPLGVSELARRLDESKGRIHRHLSTMRALGLVTQEAATEHYALGWKVFQWGSAANAGFGIRRIADEHITALRDATEHTAVFAIPADYQALVLTSVSSESRIALVIKHGVTLSPSASALGRVVIAFSQPQLQEQVILGSLKAHTDASITSPKLLAKRFQLIQERYYDVAVNENTYGISTLAAPVFDEQGNIAGATGIVGSPYTIKADPDPGLLYLVQNTAKSISEALGSRRWDTVTLPPKP